MGPPGMPGAVGLAVGKEQSMLSVLEACPVGVVILDSDQKVMFWNSRMLELVGGMEGADFQEAAHKLFMDDEQHGSLMREFERRGEVEDMECTLVLDDGTTRWVSVSVQRRVFEDKVVAISWFYDLTARKQAELLVRNSEDALLSVLEASPVGAAIMDMDGHVLFWNSRLIDILGMQGEAFAEAASLTFDGDTGLRDHLMAELRTHGQVRDFPVTKSSVAGDLHVLVSLGRVTFERQPGILMWIYDVSDLEKAKGSAVAATEAKSAFLATMSHEIRTPMNGVLTMADLLAETRLSTEQLSMVTTIRDAGRSLLTIINDILDFSKIEAGKLDIEVIPMRPREVLEGVSNLLATRAHEAGLKLNTRVEPQVPEWVEADPTRVRQILMNLVGNAIKFTPQGGVSVILRQTSLGLIRCEVHDTGIGMDEAQRAGLFRPFTQADASTSRRFGGSGLGLSICNGLVGLMGGAMGCTSKPGAGSTFWFEIPAPPTDPPREVEQAVAAPRRLPRYTGPSLERAAEFGVLILVAEDNRTNREVLGRLLDRLGLAYHMVEDGRKALEILTDPAESWKYGLLLSDCHMPEMDGWELTTRLREYEAETGQERLPILALTADVMKGAADRCFKAGMDDYLIKPVDGRALDATVEKYLPVATMLRVEGEEPAEAEEAAAVFGDADKAIDVKVLADLVGDDPAALVETLGHFLEAADGLVNEIKAGLADPDKLPAGESIPPAETTHRAAHSLKSACRYVGASLLANLAAAVEEKIEEAAIDEARGYLPDLFTAYAAVRRAVDRFAHRHGQGPAGNDAAGGEAAADDADAALALTHEAADAITDRLAQAETLEDIDLLGQQLAAVLEACSFQDLTNPKLRRAVARLLKVEESLQLAADRLQASM